MAKRKMMTMLSECCEMERLDGPINNDGLKSGLSVREKLGPDTGGTVKSQVLIDPVYPREKTGQDVGGVF